MNKKGNLTTSLSFFVLVLYFAIAFLPRQVQSSQENAFNLLGFMQNISSNEITRALIEETLPRQKEDVSDLVLRLRGGAITKSSSESLEETPLKQYVRIGALFTAAYWDWQLYMKKYLSQKKANPKDDSSIIKMTEFSLGMQDYFINVNHRLGMQGASRHILSKMDSLSDLFSSSRTPDLLKNCSEINNLFESIYIDLKTYLLDAKEIKLGFALGEWLVWEARLSYLSLNSDLPKSLSYRWKMNNLYKKIYLVKIAKLSNKLLGQNDKDAPVLKKALLKLNKTFLVKNPGQVKSVQSGILNIFNQLEIKFPNFKL